MTQPQTPAPRAATVDVAAAGPGTEAVDRLDRAFIALALTPYLAPGASADDAARAVMDALRPVPVPAADVPNEATP